MKKYFLTGLILILPITITLMVLLYLVDLFTHPFIGVATSAVSHMGLDIQKHASLALFFARIITLIFLVGLLSFIGLIAQKIFITELIKLMQKTFARIPIVKPIYLTLKELTKILFSKDVKAFGKTVLISFPRVGSMAVGFEVLKTPAEITKKFPQINKTVFVPTAPHPISGFLLFVAKEEFQEVDLSFEDTLKYVISCGVVVPEEKKEMPHL